MNKRSEGFPRQIKPSEIYEDDTTLSSVEEAVESLPFKMGDSNEGDKQGIYEDDTTLSSVKEAVEEVLPFEMNNNDLSAFQELDMGEVAKAIEKAGIDIDDPLEELATEGLTNMEDPMADMAAEDPNSKMQGVSQKDINDAIKAAGIEDIMDMDDPSVDTVAALKEANEAISESISEGDPKPQESETTIAIRDAQKSETMLAIEEAQEAVSESIDAANMLEMIAEFEPANDDVEQKVDAEKQAGVKKQAIPRRGRAARTAYRKKYYEGYGHDIKDENKTDQLPEVHIDRINETYWTDTNGRQVQVQLNYDGTPKKSFGGRLKKRHQRLLETNKDYKAAYKAFEESVGITDSNAQTQVISIVKNKPSRFQKWKVALGFAAAASGGAALGGVSAAERGTAHTQEPVAASTMTPEMVKHNVMTDAEVQAARTMRDSTKTPGEMASLVASSVEQPRNIGFKRSKDGKATARVVDSNGNLQTIEFGATEIVITAENKNPKRYKKVKTRGVYKETGRKTGTAEEIPADIVEKAKAKAEITLVNPYADDFDNSHYEKEGLLKPGDTLSPEVASDIKDKLGIGESDAAYNKRLAEERTQNIEDFDNSGESGESL